MQNNVASCGAVLGFARVQLSMKGVIFWGKKIKKKSQEQRVINLGGFGVFFFF